jgi:hypothetical protein
MSFFVPLVSFVLGWIDLDEGSALRRPHEADEELEPLLVEYDCYGSLR